MAACPQCGDGAALSAVRTAVRRCAIHRRRTGESRQAETDRPSAVRRQADADSAPRPTRATRATRAIAATRSLAEHVVDRLELTDVRGRAGLGRCVEFLVAVGEI